MAVSCVLCSHLRPYRRPSHRHRRGSGVAGGSCLPKRRARGHSDPEGASAPGIEAGSAETADDSPSVRSVRSVRSGRSGRSGSSGRALDVEALKQRGGAAIAETLLAFESMPQPRLTRAPDLTPPPSRIVFTDRLAPAARQVGQKTGYAVVLSWLVWLADVLYMFNLIPGDFFRNIWKNPLMQSL